MSASPVTRRRLVALLALHTTLIFGYLGHLGQDLASRARIVTTDFPAYYTGATLLLPLAVLRPHAALEEAADGRAGLWLFVLGMKPQLLPLLVVFLAAHRRWRVLGVAAACGVVAFVVSSAVLGWAIWPRYLAGLP